MPPIPAGQRVLPTAGGPPLMVSPDGRVAVVPVPIAAELSGFALNESITAMHVRGSRIAKRSQRPNVDDADSHQN